MNQPAFEYDVFLSHNRADKDWTRMLAARIERETWNGRALKVFYSERDIRPGQSVPQRMQDALTKSRKVALILSSEALASPWVEVEYLSTLYADLSKRREHLIPLMRRECKPPYLVAPLRYIDFRDDANFEPAFRELLAVIKDEPLPDDVETLHATSLHTAPIPRTPPYGFVARYDDQGNDLAARVSQSLKQDRAVALLGSGGVGKTTLAAEIARTMQADGARVVWASADGRADFALTTLLDEAATQLGSADLRTLALEQKTNAVRDLLAESRAMIVLDNFETIAVKQQKAIAAFVNTLSGPALITSRLEVEGADRVGVGAMSPEEARDFLTRLIANSPKRNALMPLMDNIAQTAERNPMVMRWIVGQLELAQRMSDVLDELSYGAGDAATRVFGRSFGLLNADAQAALLSLALCVPSADRAALAFTAGFVDDIKRVNDALRQLAGLQLLETDEKSERLSVVGLTRRFTNAQLGKDPNAAQYRKRFVDYFVRYVEAHAQTTPEDFDALEAERENLLAAMDVAFAAQDWQSVMLIAGVMVGPYEHVLYIRGYWDDAIVRGELAAEAARRQRDESAVAAFTANAATIHYHRGEYNKARNAYEHALETLKSSKHEQGIVAISHQLGMIAQDQGDYETARQRYAESLEIKKELGDQSGIASTLHQLGTIALAQGEYKVARQYYEESLGIEKKLDYRTAFAKTLNALGIISTEESEFKEAMDFLTQSLELSRRLGDQLEIGYATFGLARLAEKQGNNPEAARLFRESLEIFERLKSREAEIARKSLERVEGGQRTTTD